MSVNIISFFTEVTVCAIAIGDKADTRMLKKISSQNCFFHFNAWQDYDDAMHFVIKHLPKLQI